MQNKEVLKNELVCGIDWIEFTCSEEWVSSVGWLIIHLGYNMSDFVRLDKGGLGYMTQHKHVSDSIHIYSEGQPGMGIHVKCSGSAVVNFLNTFKNTLLRSGPWGDAYEVPDFKYDPECVFPLFCKWVLQHGHFTRIDLSIDDIGVRFFSVDEIYDLVRSGNCVSKFRKIRKIVDETFLGSCVGNTLYMGSRQSGVMLRVYDKQLEQYVDFPWVRWELEVKQEKADVLAEAFINNASISLCVVGVLSDYVRFIERDDSNVTRCSLLPLWQKFLDGISKLSLVLAQKEKTIERKLAWIERQVKPTLAGLCNYFGGDLAYVLDGLYEHFERLSLADKLFYSGGRYAVETGSC